MSHAQLTFTLANDRATASLIDRESGRVLGEFASPAKAAEVTQLGERLQFIVARQGREVAAHDIDDLLDVGQQLAEAVLGRDLVQCILTRRPASVLIALPARLRRVPFELMVLDDQVFGCEFAVGRVVGELLQTPRRASSASESLKRIGLIADPTFELLHAQYESQLISNLWFRRRDVLDMSRFQPQTSFVNREAAVQTLGSTQWLHFCGHGKVDSTTGVRGWEFQDGLLTVEELLARGSRRAPAFVFANACGSAECPSDSARVTLPDLLMQQGCEHFIGTLAPVRDEGCLPFVEAFYRAILAGRSIGEAVREGRRAVRSQLGVENLLWSTYELRGDPSVALLPQSFVAPVSIGTNPHRARPDGYLPHGYGSQEADNHRRKVGGDGDRHRATDSASEFPSQCLFCGKLIQTENGIGRREGSQGVVCRACHRAKPAGSLPARSASECVQSGNVVANAAVASPTMDALAGSASLSVEPTFPLLPESLVAAIDESWNAVPIVTISPAHQSELERFIPSWLAAIERFDTYADQATGKSLRVAVEARPLALTLGDEDPIANSLLTSAVQLVAKQQDATTNQLPSMLWRVVSSESAPCNIADIFAAMSELPSANANYEQVVCLASFTGWDETARDFVESTQSSSYFHRYRSLLLFDLRDHRWHARVHDFRVEPWLPLFDFEAEHLKIVRICESIGKRLPLEVSLGVTQLAEELHESPAVVLKAMRKAAIDFRLKLDEVPPFGWVLS